MILQIKALWVFYKWNKNKVFKGLSLALSSIIQSFITTFSRVGKHFRCRSFDQLSLKMIILKFKCRMWQIINLFQFTLEEPYPQRHLVSGKLFKWSNGWRSVRPLEHRLKWSCHGILHRAYQLIFVQGNNWWYSKEN